MASNRCRRINADVVLFQLPNSGASAKNSSELGGRSAVPGAAEQRAGGQPDTACSALELFDWLGAVFSHAELNNEPDSFLSSYCCPQPSTVVARASLCTVTGFILPEKICLLLEQLCRYFDEPKLAPWVTLAVQGFADSPVSWRENEHGFRRGGEHLYNFVIFNNRDYWLHMAVGADDDCPP